MTVINDTERGADTGIIDTDEFSFVLCINISKPLTAEGGVFFQT